MLKLLYILHYSPPGAEDGVGRGRAAGDAPALQIFALHPYRSAAVLVREYRPHTCCTSAAVCHSFTVLNGSGTPVAFHRLLVDALEDWLYKSWVSKVLSALKHCCGRALRLELQRENRLMDLLTQVAQRVRTADKTKRKVRFNSLIHFSFRFVSEMKPL